MARLKPMTQEEAEATIKELSMIRKQLSDVCRDVGASMGAQWIDRTLKMCNTIVGLKMKVADKAPDPFAADRIL